MKIIEDISDLLQKGKAKDVKILVQQTPKPQNPMRVGDEGSRGENI